MKKEIPNIITLSNLSCGVLAIIFAFDFNKELSFLFICLGLFLDFFDGLAARILKVDGELGKQLDSLADIITFGVAPGILLYQLFINFQVENIESLFKYSFIILPCLSAYRLAKFNLDKNQTKGFIGLPTPITALFCASWVFIEKDYSFIFELVFGNPLFFTAIILIISLLLISKIKLFSFKFSLPFQIKYNLFQLIFLIISISFIVLFGLSGFALIYVFYILMSILYNFAPKKGS